MERLACIRALRHPRQLQPARPPDARSAGIVRCFREARADLYVCYVAVRASREVVIDAPPEAIMDALADIKAVPSWSSVHKRAEVIDTYADGRPHHVKVTAKLMGIVDTEVLEYHWGPNWLVWDAEPTDRQHGQHVEYTLQPEGGGTTRVSRSFRPPLLVQQHGSDLNPPRCAWLSLVKGGHVEESSTNHAQHVELWPPLGSAKTAQRGGQSLWVVIPQHNRQAVCPGFGERYRVGSHFGGPGMHGVLLSNLAMLKMKPLSPGRLGSGIGASILRGPSSPMHRAVGPDRGSTSPVTDSRRRSRPAHRHGPQLTRRSPAALPRTTSSPVSNELGGPGGTTYRTDRWRESRRGASPGRRCIWLG